MRNHQARALRLATIVLAGTTASSAAGREGFSELAGMQTAQVTMREQVIIRVQTMQRRAPRPNQLVRPEPKIVWREKKAPRCVMLSELAGISNIDADNIDLVLKGGTRIRAKLDDDCPALDFYSGFYFKPTADGKMCADRDSIHSRSGAQCEISKFRKLVP